MFSTRTRIRTLGAAVAVFAATSALILAGSAPALADTESSVAVAAPPGAHQFLAAPFTCSPGKVILALSGSGQGPTQLYSGTFGQGTVSFAPLGTPTRRWNATGYNPEDGYFYGVTGETVLRIQDDGSVQAVGTLPTTIKGANVGAFDDAGNFWVSGANATVLYRIDVTTLQATPLQLPEAVGSPDLTFAHGYLWGLSKHAPEPILRRVDLSSGAITNIGVTGIPSNPTNLYGAAFTYGNGRLGFYSQQTSALLRIRVNNPGSANPTATVQSVQTGPSAPGGADGASCFSVGTDLQVIVDAPESAAPNTPIDYSLTVRNNGPAVSSGWTLTNVLPDNLSDASTDTAGCSIAGGVLTCTGGSLSSGDDVVIHFTATGPGAGTVLNPAEVAGNEADTDPTNDTDSATTEIAPDAGTPMIDPPVAAGVIGAGALVGGVLLFLRRRRRPTTTGA